MLGPGLFPRWVVFLALPVAVWAILGSSIAAAQSPSALAASFGPSNLNVSLRDPRITKIGRYDSQDQERPRFGYPGAGIVFRFQGNAFQIAVSVDSDLSALTLVIDHSAPILQLLKKGTNEIKVAEGLDDGPHTVEIYKRTESWQGIVTFLCVRLPEGAELLSPPVLPARKLMFVGDSVTCGAGVENNAQCKADPEKPANDAYNSYGMVLGRRLDAQTQLVCYGGRGLERDYRGLTEADGIVNAPQFFRLAIASDDAGVRAPWDASRWQPDAILVSLGTNDFNLQKAKPLDEKKWIGEYVVFVKQLRKDYPQAVIFLTEGAIVIDPLLRNYVQRTVTDAADVKVKYVAATHYPGNGCDGHPTRTQHLHMADDLEPVLRQNLGW